MVDDHKYSLNRTVAYRHPEPGCDPGTYGPGGPERTSGTIIGVRLIEDLEPRWQYTIRNAFCDETRDVCESDIFHGTDQGYLDLRRRDDIAWSVKPAGFADQEAADRFWQGALRQFIRKDIPKLLKREEDDERARREGRDLGLAAGDYIKVRGDLRQESARLHNLYAKVLSVSAPDAGTIDLPDGPHALRASYRVLLDDGSEADIYDAEVKAAYTTHGRTTVLNWRAATFLAEAFGDDPPYDLRLDYLNGHIFGRAELETLSAHELADLLAGILYVKGLITWEEISAKQDSLAGAPETYLRDQILAHSRFDMERNRELTAEEIARIRDGDQRLRDLIE